MLLHLLRSLPKCIFCRRLLSSYLPQSVLLASRSSRRFFATKPLSTHTRQVLSMLQKLHHPGTKKDLVHSHITAIETNDTEIAIQLKLDQHYRALKQQITQLLETSPEIQKWCKKITVRMAPEQNQTQPPIQSGLSKVKHVIAISSCKGGVGKSTISLNLAYSLQKFLNQKIGLLDADLYGSSIPSLLPPHSQQIETRNGFLEPLDIYGVKMMSFSFLKNHYDRNKKSDDSAFFVRGPIASSTLNTLLNQTHWDVELLLVDCPPGTSDIHLTLSQSTKLSSVVVTTPSELAQVDVIRGLKLWKKTNVRVLVLVENLSYFACDQCDKKHHLFDVNEKLSSESIQKEFEIPHLVKLPLLPTVNSTKGPFVLQNHENKREQDVQKSFDELARMVWESLQQQIDNASVTYSRDDGSIILTANGSNYVVPPRVLRLECQCAACVNEVTNVRMLNPERIPFDVRPIGMQPKGNYAVAIRWSDGHASSIYTHEQIKALTESFAKSS